MKDESSDRVKLEDGWGFFPSLRLRGGWRVADMPVRDAQTGEVTEPAGVFSDPLPMPPGISGCCGGRPTWFCVGGVGQYLRRMDGIGAYRR